MTHPVIIDDEEQAAVSELRPSVVLEADPARSTYGVSDESCSLCDRHTWSVRDIEETGVGFRSSGIDATTRRGHVKHWDRVKDHGLFVKKSSLRKVDVFRFPQRGWIICTERFRTHVVTSGLTNWSFDSVGETF